jgi:hypothetical protein
MESRLRVRLVRGGLPKPAVQYEVRDEYGFVLAMPETARRMWDVLTFRAPASLARGTVPAPDSSGFR